MLSEAKDVDALAEQRRSRGLVATSVAWGAWEGGGMFAGLDAAAQLRRRGLTPMAPSLAVTALLRAQPESTITVADVDWSRFAPAFAAARPRPLLHDLPEARRALELAGLGVGPGASAESDAARAPPGAAAALLDALRPLPESERLRRLTSLVVNETARVLGHADPSRIASNRGFGDQGIDSLSALELRKRLQSATGLPAPATLTFNHPTPQRVAVWLRQALGSALGAAGAPEAPGTARLAAAGSDPEPIAIVGLALRFPGGVGDLDQP